MIPRSNTNEGYCHIKVADILNSIKTVCNNDRVHNAKAYQLIALNDSNMRDTMISRQLNLSIPITA